MLYGEAAGGLGTFFDTRVLVKPMGGSVKAEKEAITVDGADSVLIILSTGSSYSGFDKRPSGPSAPDPAVQSKAALAAISTKTFEQLHTAHVADYRQLFDRVALDLGKPTSQSALPTDQRIEKYANGGDEALAALYFQFGRYLMIAGSRPRTQPLNLQGIWNAEVVPPWASAYTTS